MCTSLIYRDASNRPYLGRTLELSMNLPYQVLFMPRAGSAIAASILDSGQPALSAADLGAYVLGQYTTVPDATAVFA